MPSLFTVTLVYLLAAASGLGTFAIVWRRRDAPGGYPLALMLLAMTMWAVMDAVELHVSSMAGKQLNAQIEYIGIVSVAPLFVHAAIELSGRTAALTPRVLFAIWSVPLSSLVLAWTNDRHHWLWASIEPPSGDSPFALYRYGWWFWVLAAQNYLLLIAATVMLLRATRRVGRHFRAGMMLVIVAVALPWIGNAMYNLKLGPWPGFNWLTLSFTISGALLSLVVLKEGLLDLLPHARGALLEMMTDGVVILDRDGRTMFVNEVARDVLGLTEAALADIVGVSSLRDTPDVWRSEASIGSHWVDIRVVPVPDRWGKGVGRLIVARDITARKRLEQERERLIDELQEALRTVMRLEGLLPMCANCRKIRDDGGYWARLDDYLSSRARVEFTHAICPDCAAKLYPNLMGKRKQG